MMREGETEFVRAHFAALAPSFFVEDARGAVSLGARPASPSRTEAPRHWREVRRVQQRILECDIYLDGRWILGQGTIYPDTIESGGTPKPI